MQLMLVNPSKRGKKKMAVKKRRTAAQKRATRKLVAFNKARRVKRNPTAKRKAPAKSRTTTPRAPSRATGRAPSKRLVRRRANTKRGYFPNPSRRSTKMTIKNVVNTQLKPAAIGASGAIVLDVGYGYLGGYIPEMLNTGMVKHATKGVVAIALGMIASNFVKNATVNSMVQGAMTVTMHDAMKEAMQTYAPSIPLGDVGYYSPSPVQGIGYFSDDSGNGYADSGLGYFSSDTGTGYANSQQPFDTSTVE